MRINKILLAAIISLLPFVSNAESKLDIYKTAISQFTFASDPCVLPEVADEAEFVKLPRAQLPVLSNQLNNYASCIAAAKVDDNTALKKLITGDLDGSVVERKKGFTFSVENPIIKDVQRLKKQIGMRYSTRFEDYQAAFKKLQAGYAAWNAANSGQQ